MQCYIYKSRRKIGSYLYLRERDAFDGLPAALREGLGELQFVMELQLSPQRKLAQADTAMVLANLATCGFHLQVPPREGGQAGVSPTFD